MIGFSLRGLGFEFGHDVSVSSTKVKVLGACVIRAARVSKYFACAYMIVRR